jgi:hypothetical protein
METDSMTHLSTTLLDAVDGLKRASDLLNYVLNRRTTDDDPGESWVIETISAAVEKARAELNDAARSARQEVAP